MGINIKSDGNKIELAVYNQILATVTPLCDLLAVGRRNPKINPASSVYCTAPIPILDLDAVSKTTMRIEIYVKNLYSGFKDSTKISLIRDAIITLVNGVLIDGSYYVEFTGEISGDDNSGFSYLLLNISVIIV